ncbi:hypothetical protein NA78x_001208 [Anatilimnocola sp. NA78]|uniref:hypothetical protein n=1 Tax=Anatilimnocola sp. NA78 TaxID=3415683 RepID=UPI003CE4BDE8
MKVVKAQRASCIEVSTVARPIMQWVVGYCLLCKLCGSIAIAADDNITKLANSDVSWSRFMGLLAPELTKRVDEAIVQLTRDDIPKLIKMIEDPSRFAVAHVILAEVYRIDLTLSGERFHGLRVDATAKGTKYPDHKVSNLSTYWKDIARTHSDNAKIFLRCR